MLEDGQIESLDDWSDDKEYVYSIMDRKFDYLWWEDKDGFHFVDRLWHDYGMNFWDKELLESFEDETIEERMKTNELELHFKTLKDVKNWINIKKGEKQMKNYKVVLRVWGYVTMEVEAEDEEEAVDIAWDTVNFGDLENSDDLNAEVDEVNEI